MVVEVDICMNYYYMTRLFADNEKCAKSSLNDIGLN